MPEKNTFCAVLFDLDGTLLDTIEDIATVLNRILEERGFPSFSIEACKKMVGEGMEILIRRALPGVSLSAAEIADIVDAYRIGYRETWKNHSRPYPGILELLEGLKSRGVRSAVLSNKSHPFTIEMIRMLLPFPFEIIRGAMPGIPLKPDPRAALRIAAEMGVPPAAFIFTGDTDVDMETARAAGMYPAGALWGFRGAAELEASGAAVLLKSPGDLLRLWD